MNWALILLGCWVALMLFLAVRIWVAYWRGRHATPYLVYDRRCNGRPHSLYDIMCDYETSLTASRERRGQ